MWTPRSETSGSTSIAVPTTTRHVIGPCRVTPDPTGYIEAYLPGVGRADEFRPSDLVRHGAQPRPADWQPHPQSGFDWNDDGRPDTLTYDQQSGTVTVDWTDGRINVTDVQLTTTVRDHGGSPAMVGDVTGDGRLDLGVTTPDRSFAVLGVLTGEGSTSVSKTVSFADMAANGTGWMNPPKKRQIGVFADNSPVIRELPLGGATLRPVWDLTGDGVLDIALDNPGGRSTGASYYFAGKPCM